LLAYYPFAFVLYILEFKYYLCYQNNVSFSRSLSLATNQKVLNQARDIIELIQVEEEDEVNVLSGHEEVECEGHWFFLAVLPLCFANIERHQLPCPNNIPQNPSI